MFRDTSVWQPSVVGPVGVLLVGMAMAAAGGLWLHQLNTSLARADLAAAGERIADAISQRLRQPIYGLHGARGLYATNVQVNRQQFRAYVASRDLEREFPGVRGLGFIERVPRDDQAAFVAREQADGAPQFAIRQLADRAHDLLYVIRFIEPQARNAGAAGLDVGSEPKRRAAAQLAIDSGQPTVTEAVILVQDERRSPGVLLFVPMYAKGVPLSSVAERRQALAGLLYATIVLGEVLLDVSEAVVGNAGFALFESADGASGANPLFDSSAAAGSASAHVPRYELLRSVMVPGRTLALRVRSTPAFDASHSSASPWWFFIAGTLISGLLAALLRQQATGRRRAEALAQNMTVELDRLAKVARHTSNAVSITDRQTRIQWINEGFTRITGYTLDEARGRTPGELLGSGEAQASVLQALEDSATHGTQCRVEICNRDKNGHLYWTDTEVQPLVDAQGQVTGFMELGTDISARRRVQDQLEAALRDNQALLSTIHLHAIVSIADRNGDITDVNDEFCRISGYSRSELVGQNHRIVNSRVQPASFWSDMWRTISSGTPWRGEVCNRAKDGSLYWVDTVVAPFQDAAGRIEKYISIRTDITAGKRVADALVRERQRLDDIIEGTNAGTWEWNMVSGEVRFNERWAAMFGYTLAELSPVSADTFVAHVHPDDLSHSRDMLRRHLSGSSSFYECEMRLRHKAGHWVWVLARGRLATRTQQGLPEWVAGTNLDITERKSAEAQAQASARLLRGAIDTIDEAFVLYDPEDRLVLCNDKYRQMYTSVAHLMVPGARFEDLIRASAERGDYNEAVGRVDAWVAERMAAHRAANTMLVQRLHNGRTLRIVERRMPDGHTVGFRIDITELVQATEAAQDGSRAKSQFLANMSHEIRTPMNAVLGMLALLRKTQLTTRQADYATKAENAARALLGLIDDILDISKVEAGKLVLELHPFRIDHQLRDLSVILSTMVGQKLVEVLFDVDPALPRQLVGDAMRLQQILINLAANAIKFTPAGEVVVSLRVLRQEPQSVTLEVAVRDTGIGIAPENQARIFDGFTQAEASTTRRFGGTGLGVAISQRLVAMMGGRLELASTLGQGSRFHFEITLAVADPAGALALPGDRAVPWRTLVVDDNPVARELLERMCRSLGWLVDVADGGESALDLLQRQAAAGVGYQAMFVDWQMPGLDGWQTCQRIREMQLAGVAPVIVMVTAHGRELLLQRSQEDQDLLDGFLVKPVTASMLLDAVLDARTGHGAANAVPQAVPDLMRLAGMRILVVEDNANNQQVVRELLGAEGALIHIASDGQEGVDAVANATPPFDVVLMDLQMPVMDGFTATRRIRTGLGLAQLPIVAMTANALASDREACLAAGMNDHVGKPFNLGDLVRVLRKNAGWPELAAPAAPAAVPELTARQIAAADAAGVDLAVALRRMGGRLDVYRRMLQLFVDDLRSAPGRLRALAAEGDAVQVSNLLHTIKGVAASLGADGVSAAAAAAEAQLAAVPQGATQVVGPACTVVDAALGGLDSLLAALPDGVPTSATADAREPAALVSGLQAIAHMLRHGDMAATDAIAQLQRGGDAAAAASLQPVADAIARLEFDRALRLCEDLIEGQTT